MATYWVCSDNIDGKENSRIEALCKALKEKGHNASNGGVGPNTIQSHGQTSSANGQIGVFICGGVDIQVFWDFVQGIGSYYHYKRFIYVYASDTATTDKWLTCNGAKNTPTVQAWDDNYSGGQGDAIGKTVDQYCNEHKDKIWYACGPLGCTFNDVIQNFLKGEGAEDSTDDSKKESTSGSSIKDALKKAVSKWDGDVEVKIIDDTVYVNKIPDPGDTKLVIDEYNHAYYDSITVTDINQDTINQLITNFGDYELTIKDDTLIKRFGLKPQRIELENTVKTLNDAKKALQREWNKIRRDDGRSIELKLTGNPNIKVGRWVRVYLPSYFIDDYMYISKASHDEDASEWSTSITLVDYPPSFGAYVEETKETETEDADTDIDSTDADVTADTEGE